MKSKPRYMTSGSRSAVEGSGVTGAVPMTEIGGETNPPGLVSYPTGAAEVTYGQGASLSATAAFNRPGRNTSVQMVPFKQGGSE